MKTEMNGKPNVNPSIRAKTPVRMTARPSPEASTSAMSVRSETVADFTSPSSARSMTDIPS